MKTPNLLLSPLYKLLELPAVYALSQIAGKPTTDRYRLLATNVKVLQDSIILDLGCGVGAFRDCFPSLYVGIDINVDYLKQPEYWGEEHSRQWIVIYWPIQMSH